MIRLALIFTLPLILTACNNSESSEEKKEPTYEEKVTKAITDFTGAKYVENVKLVKEVTAEAANSEIDGLNEALDKFKTGLRMYELTLESYESVKENMSIINTEKFNEFAGLSNESMNYDSLMNDVIGDIERAKVQIAEVEGLIAQYTQSLDNSGGKSPFTVFKASVDAELRMFALSPKDSKEVKVLFEINQ